jgi:transposase-like protein
MTQNLPAENHPWRHNRKYAKRPAPVRETGNSKPWLHLKQEIWQMHREGVGISKIAAELKISTGFVQTVLHGI